MMVSYFSSGVHPHPGQRVERVQALHRVQGAPQPPEDPVSTGGHLQLPTQESHREQGKLTVTQSVWSSLSTATTVCEQQLIKLIKNLLQTQDDLIVIKSPG